MLNETVARTATENELADAAIESDSSSRTLILEAIKNGDNTLHGIARSTGLSTAVIGYELKILNNLEVVRVAGPPLPSYWLKNRQPTRKLFTRDGLKVEQVEESTEPGEITEKFKPSQAALKIEKTAAKVDFDFIGVNSHEVLREIPVSHIEDHPDNPRGYVDVYEESFVQLVESIREVGVQEPLIVTVNEQTDNFRIVMGHRRRAAAQSAGLESVPCIVRRYENSDAEVVVMLIENIQRSDLKPMAEARAFFKLHKNFDKDLNAVARRTGLTQSYILNRMRLLKLDETIQRMVDRRELGTQHGLLLSVLDHSQQKKIIHKAQSAKLADLKTLVQETKNGLTAPPKWKKKKSAVTSKDENFTRSWAIREMKAAGDTLYPAKYFADAFDDVCQDACAEMNDEQMCIACPVPRFIASILRRRQGAGDE